MTYALVKHGQFITTQKHDKFNWDGYYLNNVPLLTAEERQSFGVYEFIVDSSSIPEGQREVSRTYNVDDVSGTVTEVVTYKTITEIQSV